MVRTLANWFQREEPAVVKLLLRAVGILSRHESTHRGGDLPGAQGPGGPAALAALGRLPHPACVHPRTLPGGGASPKESEHLRLTAFEIYGALLAKVSRRVFVFPLRHQVLNLLILLVLHLEDANGRIAQIARPTLCHLATLLGWSKLRATFAEKDIWTILSALLQQEVGRALWFLKQSVQLFRSPQVPIRRAAVWFAGQIIQTLGAEEAREMDEVHAGQCKPAPAACPSDVVAGAQKLGQVGSQQSPSGGGDGGGLSFGGTRGLLAPSFCLGGCPVSPTPPPPLPSPKPATLPGGLPWCQRVPAAAAAGGLGSPGALGRGGRSQAGGSGQDPPGLVLDWTSPSHASRSPAVRGSRPGNTLAPPPQAAGPRPTALPFLHSAHPPP
ncbi:uncharacterized protein LOC133228223 isoform X2 [Bos javanicus]|uniref:uncharacterized protein LOC133228223 isoform X2 n=1 Tax=Bos javanicus TaxID=9906 RepID=UPI002AA6CC87|nr:uncharacterized protein LOC133228223 isoform X2 [Bos javanicus]